MTRIKTAPAADTICRRATARQLRTRAGFWNHVATWCDDCNRYTVKALDHHALCIVREGFGD